MRSLLVVSWRLYGKWYVCRLLNCRGEYWTTTLIKTQLNTAAENDEEYGKIITVSKSRIERWWDGKKWIWIKPDYKNQHFIEQELAKHEYKI